MEANELMIGDWVQFDNGKDVNHPNGTGDMSYVQVESIGELAFEGITRFLILRNGKREYQRTLGALQPIPLTQEILEKNGFKEVEINDFRLFRDKEYDCKGIRISFTSKGVCLWKGDSIGISCKSSGCCHYGIPAYVHLLQHALRLAGIKKEIVL